MHPAGTGSSGGLFQASIRGPEFSLQGFGNCQIGTIISFRMAQAFSPTESRLVVRQLLVWFQPDLDTSTFFETQLSPQGMTRRSRYHPMQSPGVPIRQGSA